MPVEINVEVVFGTMPVLCDACARPVERKTIASGKWDGAHRTMDTAERNLPCGCRADAVSLNIWRV